ncbi:MAG: hypothetical protein ACI4II_04880 [Acutalibacteraceae bacterium]
MIRRTYRRIIPIHAIFPLHLTLISFLISYYGSKFFNFLSSPQKMLDMTTAWDKLFPFCPEWAIIYIGAFFFWMYQYTMIARESPEKACKLATADFTAKIICFCFFIFMPTTNVRPNVDGDGFILGFMRLIYLIDSPNNLFPSMHCFVSWLGTRYMYECKLIKHRFLICTLCTVGTILVFVSTLLVRQHVILDVISGVAVAEIGYLIARFTKLPQVISALNERFMKTSFCRSI